MFVNSVSSFEFEGQTQTSPPNWNLFSPAAPSAVPVLTTPTTVPTPAGEFMLLLVYFSIHFFSIDRQKTIEVISQQILLFVLLLLKK